MIARHLWRRGEWWGNAKSTWQVSQPVDVVTQAALPYADDMHMRAIFLEP